MRIKAFLMGLMVALMGVGAFGQVFYEFEVNNSGALTIGSTSWNLNTDNSKFTEYLMALCMAVNTASIFESEATGDVGERVITAQGANEVTFSFYAHALRLHNLKTIVLKRDPATQRVKLKIEWYWQISTPTNSLAKIRYVKNESNSQGFDFLVAVLSKIIYSKEVPASSGALVPLDFWMDDNHSFRVIHYTADDRVSTALADPSASDAQPEWW